jgi:hypothetical protein
VAVPAHQQHRPVEVRGELGQPLDEVGVTGERDAADHAVERVPQVGLEEERDPGGTLLVGAGERVLEPFEVRRVPGRHLGLARGGLVGRLAGAEPRPRDRSVTADTTWIGQREQVGRLHVPPTETIGGNCSS